MSNTNTKIVLYFLSLHVSGVGGHQLHVTEHAQHLNECPNAVVGDSMVSENQYGSTGETVTEVNAHIWCQHGWGTRFEASYTGTADGFRAAAEQMVRD